jgi:uncharacterized membrane protein YGL010W
VLIGVAHETVALERVHPTLTILFYCESRVPVGVLLRPLLYLAFYLIHTELI